MLPIKRRAIITGKEMAKMNLLQYIFKRRRWGERPSIIILLFCFIIIGAFVGKAYADPYQQGNIRNSLSLGGSEAFDNEYFLLGFGVGFFPVDYLELGVEGQYWLGGTPAIVKIGLQTQYILPLNSPVKPYAGIFYRNTIVSGFKDMYSNGFRAGLYYNPGQDFILGLGVVHENYLTGDKSEHDEYGKTYPEFTISGTF